MPSPAETTVQYELVDSIGVITFDDGKANALGFDAIDALSAAIDRATAEAAVLVLIGREGKFSAGFDLSVMSGGDLSAAQAMLKAGGRLGLKVASSPIPVVFGVTGHALAMGGILTTCADVRIGVDGPFKIGLNEVAIGIPVPKFAVEMCRARLHSAWFTKCVQLAQLCSPQDAVEAGFLDEVVTAEALRGRVLEVAAGLTALKREPFATTRRNVRQAMLDQIEAELDADIDAITLAFS